MSLYTMQNATCKVVKDPGLTIDRSLLALRDQELRSILDSEISVGILTEHIKIDNCDQEITLGRKLIYIVHR